MLEFTHRDRRAHREVDRAIGTVLGISAGLIALATAIRTAFVGLIAVVGLAVLGVACVGWSDRFLAQYASDLRHARSDSNASGFLRAEVGSTVGLERGARPRSPSPHVRRRPRAGRAHDRDESRPSGPDEGHV